MTLRNAFEAIATEATVAKIEARKTSDGAGVLIGGTKVKYRREFNDATLADWDVVTGAGMTVAAGTGVLTVATGTTINSETRLTTKQSFSAPFKAGFGFKISQKIANQEFYVEVVAETPDGSGVDETVVAAWRIAGNDSLTNTVARYEVRNGGATRLQSANTAAQATQTVNGIYEIVLESDEVWFHSRTADGTAVRLTSYVSQTVAPDPNRRYRLRYRIVNGSVAPASTTTLTASHLTCIDYTELQAEITGGTGSNIPAQGLPVNITGGSVGVSSTTIGTSATVAGLTAVKVLSAATTNPTLVKASSGRLYGYRFANLTAAWKFVRFYNKTTAPTVGTDAPAMVVAVPPNGTADFEQTVPISFATGIGYSITGAVADLDATAVAAADVQGFLLYV